MNIVYAMRIPAEPADAELRLAQLNVSSESEQLLKNLSTKIAEPVKTVVHLEDMYIAIGTYPYIPWDEDSRSPFTAQDTNAPKPVNPNVVPAWFSYEEDAIGYRGRDAISILIAFYYAWKGNEISRANGLEVLPLRSDSELGIVAAIINATPELLTTLAPQIHYDRGTLGARRIVKILQENGISLQPGVYTIDVTPGWGEKSIQQIEIKPIHATSQLLPNIHYWSKGVVWSSDRRDGEITRGQHIVGLLTEELQFDAPVKFAGDLPTNQVLRLVGLDNNCQMFSAIPFSHDGILEVSGEVTIKGEGGSPAIQAEGILTLRGSGTLTLIAGNKSGCIGERTMYPQSYDRWTPPEWQKLKEIRIEGNLTVICKTETPNFAIGGYGCDWIPKITVEDGCTLVAPEWDKPGLSRKMTYPGNRYSGSTKQVGEPTYAMMPIEASEISETDVF